MTLRAAVSRQVEVPTQCMTCGAEWTAPHWMVIDAQEQPDAWQRCIDGTINRLRCPNGHAMSYWVPLLLIDDSRKTNIFVPVFDPPSEEDVKWRIRLVNQVIEQDPARAEYMRTSMIVSAADLSVALQSSFEQAVPYDDPPVVQRTLGVQRLLEAVLDRGTSANERIGVANRITELVEGDREALGIAAEAAGAASEDLAVQASDATYLDDAERAYRTAADFYLDAHVYSGYARVCRLFGCLLGRRAKRLRDRCFEIADDAFDSAQSYHVAMRNAKIAEEVWAERTLYAIAAVRRELSYADADTEACLQLCRERKRDIAGSNVQGLARVLSLTLGDVLFHASSGGSKIERLREALEAYKEARRSLQFPDNLHEWVELQERISHTYIEMARYRQPVFQEALNEGFRALNATVPQMGDLHTRALFLIGLTYSGWPSAEATEAAVTFLEHAKSTLRSESDPRLRYDICVNLGGVYARRSHSEEKQRNDELRASELLSAITHQIDIVVLPPGESAVERLRNQIALAMYEPKTGRQALDKAVQLAVEYDACLPLLERRGLNAELARTLLKYDNFDLAMEAFNRALNAGDRLVRQAASPLQKRYRQTDNEEIDVEVVSAAVHRGARAAQAAFLYAERAKARWHQESLALLPYPAPAEIPPNLRERERHLLQGMLEVQHMLSQSGYREVESTFITRYEQLLAELEQLWRRFEAEYEARDYVAARRSDIIAWQAVQQWLGTRRAAFLSYFVLKDCVAAFLILPDRTEPLSWQIPISKRRLEDIASRFALEVGVPGSSEETWLALAQPLTAQIAQAVAGVDILYVSKHGALHPLPVHALLWNEQSSAAAVPVAYANGIGTLLQIEARHQALTPPEGGAVIIGDPCGDLPEAGREAQEIAEMFGVKPLIGLDASVKNVRTAIHCGAVRTIHFAAHSTFDEADPNSSGIVLADGVLRARDIGWDRLHSQMVVVSGCSSGRSGASSGDEQWGLTRAFSLAGVANTVIALWDIEDASAGSIMLEFYRRLLVQSDTPASVARALLAAMLGQRARKPQTRYWSPFAFYGA